jgi:hypothetical protein
VHPGGGRGEQRTLAFLRDIVTNPATYEYAANKIITGTGAYARLGNMMLIPKGDTLSSVLSTVNRHTTFLDSPAILP